MHGLVVVDKDGKPLRNAIIWDDRRTDNVAKYIQTTTGKDVGHFTVSKLLWIKKNEPDVFAKIDKIMLPEDYIAYKLTGEITTTPQGLSQMRLWDFKNSHLDKELLDKLEIPVSMIPEIRKDIDLHGKITREVAGITGLLEGTPVYAKAGDQQSAALGNGVVGSGLVGLNSGTSGIIAIVTGDNIDKSGKGIYWMKHLNDNNLILACTLSCGASYQWLRDNVFSEFKNIGSTSPYSIINNFAEQAPPGSGGVIWLPYLKGERSPRDDSDIRACFIGIGEKTPSSMTI